MNAEVKMKKKVLWWVDDVECCGGQIIPNVSDGRNVVAVVAVAAVAAEAAGESSKMGPNVKVNFLPIDFSSSMLLSSLLIGY